MKYIATCKLIMGGHELEIMEVEDNEIFDTIEELREKSKYRCL